MKKAKSPYIALQGRALSRYLIGVENGPVPLLRRDFEIAIMQAWRDGARWARQFSEREAKADKQAEERA